MVKNFWAFLIIGGIILALFNNKGEAVAQAILGSGQTAIEIIISMTGGLALWMGLINIAKKAGLMDTLARVMKKPLGWLFPEAKNDAPALGAISMNMSANILGMGNAATPAGLEAMKELQRLNPNKTIATNAMCMFLIINSSSVQLFPATIVTLRQAAGSASPASIVLPALIATTINTIAAVIAAKLLEKY